MVEHGTLFPIALLVFQVLLLGLFGGYVTYDSEYKYKTPAGINKTNEVKKAGDFYTSFQDVHVMIFIGFGFLMTYLKRYGYGAIAYNMLLSCVCIQWATLLNAWIKQRIMYEEHPEDWKHDAITGEKISPGIIRIGFLEIMTADFTCAAILITFGALLGKTTRLQLLIIVIFECVFFAINEAVLVHFINIRDSGGSVIVHLFGAYFGLAVARMIHRDNFVGHLLEGANYHSDFFAMIGTIFLWIFWPSFNSGPVSDDPDLQRIAVVNTYFALSACVVSTFATSILVEEKFKLNMVHIQNATIAGGVAVGTSADLSIEPWGAILIGMLAGVLSVLGFTYISPLLLKIKIHDSCGVNNLHGMPAVFAGLCGTIAAASVKGPLYEKVNSGDRTFGQQAGFQFAGVCVSFAIAVFGGVLTGFVISYIPKHGLDLYNDDAEWIVAEMIEITRSGHIAKDTNASDVSKGFQGLSLAVTENSKAE